MIGNVVNGMNGENIIYTVIKVLKNNVFSFTLVLLIVDKLNAEKMNRLFKHFLIIF